MKKIENVTIDSRDYENLIYFMDKYGESDSFFSGTNDEGEETHVSFNSDKISVKTFQNNGWIRLNVYHRDFTTEETFEGRWK